MNEAVSYGAKSQQNFSYRDCTLYSLTYRKRKRKRKIEGCRDEKERESRRKENTHTDVK